MGLFTFVLGVTIHYGSNMYPMVRDGNLVFSLRLQKPYINAAVLYKHEGKTPVGRVIALSIFYSVSTDRLIGKL